MQRAGDMPLGQSSGDPRPENDAALMAETLREVGFEVIEAKNADQKTIKRRSQPNSRAAADQ